MAIAWSRISSKVIAHPPDAEAASRRPCGNGKSRSGPLYRRWVTKESRRPGSAARRRTTGRAAGAGDPRAAALPPRRHALAQLRRRPPRATVRALLSARDHDPLQKGENRTRLSGSTDAQPSVLAPRVRDPEEVPRESRRVRVLLGRVRGQPCTDRVRRLPSATNIGNQLHASDATCLGKTLGYCWRTISLYLSVP